MDLELFLVVLGLFVLLLIASLLVPVARRLNFPFTVLLAAAGVALVRETLCNADVMALGYCELLVLSVREFEKLILTEVGIKESIQRTAMERLNS